MYCKAKQAADALAVIQRTDALLASGLELVATYVPAECVARVRAKYGVDAHEDAPLAEAPNGGAQPSPKRIKVCWWISNTLDRQSTQLDAKDLQKQRAAAARSEAKAAQLAKETRGMKKISAFFAPPSSQGGK